MSRGYSNDPRRIVRLKKIKRGNGPLIPPPPVRPPHPPQKPAPPARKSPGRPGHPDARP